MYAEVCNGGDDDCDGTPDDGATCTGGYACMSGACACPAPSTVCGLLPPHWCASLDSDPSNCGACDHRCAPEATCTGGSCICPGSTPSLCGGHCVDYQSDAHNCGACMHDCGTGSCVAGACSCAAPTTRCVMGVDSECADLSGDPDHCGACDVACLYDASCVAGRCSMGVEWMAGFGSHNANFAVKNMEVGPAGDVYVQGSYGMRDFSRSPSPTLFSNTNGIVHIAPSGAIVSGHNTSMNTVIGASTAGYVVVESFNGTYAGYAGASLTCPGTNRCVAMIGAGPDGAVLWSLARPGTTTASAVVVDMDRWGDLMVAVGTSTTNFDFGGGPLAYDGTNSAFVWTFDSRNGSFVSAFRIPGTPVEVHAFADGTALVSADYTGAPSIGGVTLPAPSSSGARYYVARFSQTGVGSNPRSYTMDATSYEWPTAVDGTLDAVSYRQTRLVELFDATALTASFTGPSGASPWGITAAGRDIVEVGTSNGMPIGGVTVPINQTYVARLDGATAVPREVTAIYTPERGLMRGVDTGHVVVAVVAQVFTVGQLSMSAGAGQWGTFVANVRIR